MAAARPAMRAAPPLIACSHPHSAPYPCVQILVANCLFAVLLAILGPEGSFGDLSWICEGKWAKKEKGDATPKPSTSASATIDAVTETKA
jgi:hypothetical protein